jgi:hypothetical protein
MNTASRQLIVLLAVFVTCIAGIAYADDLGKGKRPEVFPREPFQFTARADFLDGSLGTDVPFDVPSDKRLVIENVSATLETPINQEITATQVRTILKGVIAWHSVFVPKTATFEDKINIYSGGQQVRVYADPGTTVHILVNKNASSCPFPCGTTLVFISGYLLPVESPSLAP